MGPLREAMDDAQHAYHDMYWQILEFRNQQQRDKAESEDMKAVRDDRAEKQGERVNALAQFLNPLNEQKELAQTEKNTLEQLKTTLAEKEQEKNTAVANWEQRDQTKDGQPENNGLE